MRWFTFVCALAVSSACPAGFFAAVHAQCEPCPTGFKGAFANARACTPCPVHTYQDHVGQSTCKHCPRGYAQPRPAKSYCSHPHHILQSASHTLENANEAYCHQKGGAPAYNASAIECTDGMNTVGTTCQCTACHNIEVFMIQPNQHCENGLYFEPPPPSYMYGVVHVNSSAGCVDRCARWTGVLTENFKDPSEDDSTVTLLNETTNRVCDLVSHHGPLHSNQCT